MAWWQWCLGWRCGRERDIDWRPAWSWRDRRGLPRMETRFLAPGLRSKLGWVELPACALDSQTCCLDWELAVWSWLQQGRIRDQSLKVGPSSWPLSQWRIEISPWPLSFPFYHTRDSWGTAMTRRFLQQWWKLISIQWGKLSLILKMKMRLQFC